MLSTRLNRVVSPHPRSTRVLLHESEHDSVVDAGAQDGSAQAPSAVELSEVVIQRLNDTGGIRIA